MSKKDDVKQYYDLSSKVQIFARITFICVTLFSALSLYVTPNLLSIFIPIQMVATFLNVLALWIDDNFIFLNAEKQRRKSLIENSFEINTTINKTDEYYNNDLNPSVQKLILNSFESIVFTFKIIQKMFWGQFIKMVISIVILIISFCVFSGTELLLLIFQIIFSGTYILGFASFVSFFFKVKELYEHFYQDLITDTRESTNKTIRLLSSAVEYEILKSSYKIQLSTKTFKKYNDTWSKEWIELQKQTIFYKK